jgi:hypothetical protein
MEEQMYGKQEFGQHNLKPSSDCMANAPDNPFVERSFANENFNWFYAYLWPL